MPSRLTPRSRNGITVACSLAPPASPQAATVAWYLSWVSTWDSVLPPTASMQPAQRSASSGLPEGFSMLARSTIEAAPSCFR